MWFTPVTNWKRLFVSGRRSNESKNFCASSFTPEGKPPIDTTSYFLFLLTRSLGARLNGLQIQGGEWLNGFHLPYPYPSLTLSTGTDFLAYCNAYCIFNWNFFERSLEGIGRKARQVCLTLFFFSIGEASLKLRFLNLKLPDIRECPVLSASPFSLD